MIIAIAADSTSDSDSDSYYHSNPKHHFTILTGLQQTTTAMMIA
jgi:hypothetical protein